MSKIIFERIKADLDALLVVSENKSNYEPLLIEINRFVDSLRAILALDVAMIKGSEVDFNVLVEFNNLPYRAEHIWNNPSQYSDYTDDSEDAYYKFLKFLWVVFPDGHEMQLGEYVNDTDH